MVLVSTVAEAAIAPAMISACTSRLCAARVDQAGAELREIEDARHQRDQAGEIQRDDAAREAGEAEARRKTARPGAASRAAAASPAQAGSSSATRSMIEGRRRRPRHSGLDQAAFDQAMAKTAGCSNDRVRCALASYPRRAEASVGQTAPIAALRSGSSLKR